MLSYMDLSSFIAIDCDMRIMIDEPAPVAVNVSVQMAELPEQVSASLRARPGTRPAAADSVRCCHHGDS
jgi:hypothetical protein